MLRFAKAKVQTRMPTEGYFNRLLRLPPKGPLPEDVDGFIEAARINDQATIEKYLSEFGGIVNKRDDKDRTALIAAAESGHYNLCVLLLDKGADIDARNIYCQSSLLLAARHGHQDIAALLLERGADADKEDMHYRTALTYAEQWGHSTIADLIRTEPEQRERRRIEREEEIFRRELKEAMAGVYSGIREDMDIAPPLRFKKKGPPAP
jgi:hypothetical protein